MAAGHDITRGMVAYWRLEDAASATIADAIGGNTLTNVNVSAVAGKFGLAARFPVSTSSLAIADNAALSMGGGARLTIACWVNLFDKSAEMAIVSKWNVLGSDREYLLEYNAVSDRYAFLVSADGSTVGATVIGDTLGSPSAAVWTLLVCWFDGASLFIQANNGQPDSALYAGGIRDGGSAFRVGGIPGNLIPLANGSMVDEVMVWKRPLDADERAYIWNGGNGRSLQIVPIKGEYQTALSLAQSYQTAMLE